MWYNNYRKLRKEVMKMLEILFVVVVIIIEGYLLFGMGAIVLCEIISSKTGACCMPKWAENLYDFVIEKWFFIYK
jgi:hypothetical protein